MAEKILIYYTGTIGDTIIAFPAFQMIRQTYPSAHITLLSALQGRFSATEALLKPTDYVDEFLSYTLPKHRWMRILMAGKLICKLRLSHFDELVYLARDDDRERRKRDKIFFARAGIRVFHGIDQYVSTSVNVAQRMIDTLAADGVGFPHTVEDYGNFQLTEAEKQKAGQWFDALNIPPGSIPVVYGMGGKSRNGKWPVAKHREVLRHLARRDHFFPLFFGDDTSKAEEEQMIRELRCGARAASQGFDLRESIAAMMHCKLYVGHDTGTMHMAAAAGLPCVGIFSARNPVGKWYPPGKNHVFLRHHCECEECEVPVCSFDPARCIDLITPDEVCDAAKKVIISLH
ncbi:MAG: glycosyltransferase family 9 protein [Victivallaceae bacterium]|nr:glycosyltransferase family 9 protein [Victivallaceae bacterium]